ncbi:uncharacterized protein LOC112202138 [Rosa chinensis]|uniref:uncharacterized protein LOC112202138 n=1 Tax=Rosa chinensis TaxID=74649 RepID=UPI001AD92D26|nr:uncharacterized protein LOC112202138 [Rosa chinensis]
MATSGQHCNTVSVHLDDTNYPTWHFLMQHYLRGHGLLKFVDGSYPCPPQCQKADYDSPSVNNTGACEKWLQQDSFVISMITNTLSAEALTLVIGCETSMEVWITLKRHYAANSEFHIMRLKSALQNIRKGADSIDKYLLRFKTVRDHLAVVGIRISDQEVKSLILAGLPCEYGHTRQIIREKNPISMEELRSLLLSAEFELELKHKTHPVTPLTTVVANNSSMSFPDSHFSSFVIPSTTVPQRGKNHIDYNNTSTCHVPVVAKSSISALTSTHTSPVTQIACTPQSAILSNNVNIATAYMSNTMASNGNFGMQSMPNNGCMIDFVSTPSGLLIPNSGSNFVTPYTSTGATQQLGDFHHSHATYAQPQVNSNGRIQYNWGFSQPNSNFILQSGRLQQSNGFQSGMGTSNGYQASFNTNAMMNGGNCFPRTGLVRNSVVSPSLAQYNGVMKMDNSVLEEAGNGQDIKENTLSTENQVDETLDVVDTSVVVTLKPEDDEGVDLQERNMDPEDTECESTNSKDAMSITEARQVVNKSSANEDTKKIQVGASPKALSASICTQPKPPSTATEPNNNSFQSQVVKPLTITSAYPLSVPPHPHLQQAPLKKIEVLRTPGTWLLPSTPDRNLMHCRHACESTSLWQSLPLIPPG